MENQHEDFIPLKNFDNFVNYRVFEEEEGGE